MDLAHQFQYSIRGVTVSNCSFEKGLEIIHYDSFDQPEQTQELLNDLCKIFQEGQYIRKAATFTLNAALQFSYNGKVYKLYCDYCGMNLIVDSEGGHKKSFNFRDFDRRDTFFREILKAAFPAKVTKPSEHSYW